MASRVAEQKLTVFDYVIVGSGFGGSVSAMRLTEKGYSVLVLERGKRYRDQDFPVRVSSIKPLRSAITPRF